MDFKTGLKLAGLTALAAVPTAVSFGVYGAMRDRNKGLLSSSALASISGLAAGVGIAMGAVATGLVNIPSQDGSMGLVNVSVPNSMGLLSVERKPMGLLDVQRVKRGGLGMINVQRVRGCSSC